MCGFRNFFSGHKEEFTAALSQYLSAKYVFLISSGTAALYIILLALKKLSSRKEVILPAYTAPVVFLAVKSAGLKAAACDISLKDFNIDLNSLAKFITNDTLCVILTHLFGIPVLGSENIENKIKNIFIVEDCAQSLGSKIGDLNTGKFGDIGFLSFNRGKNLPIYTGGCIFTNSQDLAKEINKEIVKIKEQNIFLNLLAAFKLISFSLAVNQNVYGVVYPIASFFKETKVPKSFSVREFTDFQKGVGTSLMKDLEISSKKRYENGKHFLDNISGLKDLCLPYIPHNSRPAFNRLPVVVKDQEKRELLVNSLLKNNIDISYMYLKAIHKIFDLGYNDSDFPNADFFAKHLLTLPTHPLVSEYQKDAIVRVIKNALG